MGTYSDLADINKQVPQLKLKPPEEKKRVGPVVPKAEVTQELTQAPTQKSTRKVTQVSKRQVNLPQTETIEDWAYRLRKVSKVRVNADVPREWKERLDDLAHRLKVGKYELMLYVIGEFLGEGQPPEDGG
jgi:hypothetical protein